MIEIAAQEEVAVIVLGSRGRSSLKAALLGSVSYGVVHNAARPVLTVPPRTVSVRFSEGSRGRT